MDAPAPAPAEPAGRQSLLADPATRVGALGPHTPNGAAAQYGPPAPSYGPVPQGAPAPYLIPTPMDAGPMAVTDLPAGLDPDELAAAPASSARRGRLRKRVAFLRAAREVLLRDLGGFVYELHRTARDIEHDAHRRLRDAKLLRLTRVDAELHELEVRLDDVRRQVVVREPGVGGECPSCGELFGSDARFCSHCGLPLTEAARRHAARADGAVAEAAVPAPPPSADEQPTQELSPEELKRAAEAEFRWPQREPAVGELGTREDATGVVRDDATSEAADELAGDVAASREDAAGEAAVPAGDMTAQQDARDRAGEDVAAQQDARDGAGGAEPPQPAGEDVAAQQDAHDDTTAGEDVTPPHDARDDTTAGAEDATGTRNAPEAHDSMASPAERRT